MKNRRKQGPPRRSRLVTRSKSVPAPATPECARTHAGGNPIADGKAKQLSDEELIRQYRKVDFPLGDPEGAREAAKKIHLNRAGANILTKQTEWVTDTFSGVIADAFIMSIMKSVDVRDAVEEMLCVQMAWTHARLGKLSAIAVSQTGLKAVEVVHDACDRAANTFRRQMLALVEYRNPHRGDTFTAIKQQNIANQQVVQNAGKKNSQSGNGSNEQGSAQPAGPEQLPSYDVGTGISTSISREDEAVAVEHRPQDTGGQESLKTQRPETR